MAHYRSEQIDQRRRPKHYLEYGLLRFILFFIHRTPLSWGLWVARRLGDFTFDVVRLRRKVTIENMKQAFGDAYSDNELSRFARSCYRNFAMTMIEFAYYGEHGVARADDKIRIEGFEAAETAAAMGAGVIFLTAHTGNWELLGGKVSHDWAPLSEISGDQKNYFVDKYTKEMRRRLGVELIPIGSSLKMVIRTLRNKGRVALVADQDAGSDGMMIDFLGRPASTSLGPAWFSYRTGAPIIIAFDRHVGDGRHETVFYPPLIPDREKPEKEELHRLLSCYTSYLEAFIRQYPDQWLWMHRRWKTKTVNS
jgi:lauroyl/myristoyl acyltransferase